jgi:protein-tyrosine phosphatase
MKKVLFVCLGNICRSPAAHGVLQAMIDKEGLKEQLSVDSAGTSNAHVGHRPDKRMKAAALKRGVELNTKARQFTRTDFEDSELIVVMDQSNFESCKAIALKREHLEKLVLMSDFTPSFTQKDVPDPYYGEEEGFELVLDMVTEGCGNIIKKLGSA